MQTTPMQTSDNIIILPITTPSATRPARLLRRMGRRCEMLGVLTLMGSSAAYGLFALAHLGL